MKGRFRLEIFVALALAVAPFTGCSSSSPSSGSTSTTSTSGSGSGSGSGSDSSAITWTENDNGTKVLDANGNQYYFSSSSGCIYSTSVDPGTSGMCLTSNSSGYENTGATNCVDPSNSSTCTLANFDVVLTNDPNSASGCIAVLGYQTGPTTNQSENVSVVLATGSVSISPSNTASAYKYYAGGAVVGAGSGIPICAGNSTYAGSYTGGSTGEFVQSLTAMVDSGGNFLMNSSADSSEGFYGPSFAGYYGYINSSGEAQFWVSSDSSLSGASGAFTENSSDEWTASGTLPEAYPTAPTTFSLTQQANSAGNTRSHQ